MKKKGWSKRFDFKPISTNELWYRSKQMTVKYRLWRESVYDELKEREKRWPFKPEDKLVFDIKVGFSSPLADCDNPIKAILDTWQNIFKFNDRYVFSVSSEKEIVKRGQEYFEVTVIEYEDDEPKGKRRSSR